MRSNDDILKMLGFAARAGRTAAGSLAVETALKRRKAKVVLYDEGLSEGSLKKLRELCERCGAMMLETEGGVLGKTIGKEHVYVACVTEKMFSDRIKDLAETTKCCTEE